MTARTIMVQGTASNAGKSLLATALCRIFKQDGWRVAPFKSQNMSNNSYITPDGREIGRAQGVQAEAAGIPASADFNPVLLKPGSDTESQVLIHGRPYGTMDFRAYRREGYQVAVDAIQASLARLRSQYDIVVIEGAGSPAEVNLRDRELANMQIAAWAEAPVLLAADIDRGGALASLVGTLVLLEPEEQDRVAGLIINKFRGDRGLLKPAESFLEQRTGKPVVGVVPYLDVEIEAEDALELGEGPVSGEEGLRICAVHLPHVSNFTDVDPLRHSPGVQVQWVEEPSQLRGADAVILPGTKSTAGDLRWLWQTGLGAAIAGRAARGVPVVGICGGYQMLGRQVRDPHGYESRNSEIPGLGLLDTEILFGPSGSKVTMHTTAQVGQAPGPLAGASGTTATGYEIHMGSTRLGPGAVPLIQREDAVLGASDINGQVWGTYLHDIFQNDGIRRTWLGWLWRRRGLIPPADGGLGLARRRDQEFDRLAAQVRASLDMDRIYAILGVDRR